jgi:type II secretion system protein N
MTFAINPTVKRWLFRIGLVGALFVLFVAMIFPTPDLVRRALAEALPAGSNVTLTNAALRPWGLRVEGLSIRTPTAQRAWDIPWLRVSPSLLGFLTNGAGRPWHVGAGICLGSIEGTLEMENKKQVLDVKWTDIDVATCLGQIGAPVQVSGRSTGTIDARLIPNGGPESGAGEIALRSAAWAPPLLQLEDVVLHADNALLRWTLAWPMLTLSEVRSSGPELDLNAQGTIRIDQRNRGGSALRIRVTLTPGPDMPAELTELLDTVPRSGGAYDFLLAGTIDVPRIEAVD